MSSVRNSVEVDFDYAPSEYVKISDGCNRFCSFCTIRSFVVDITAFLYDEIASDVKAKVESGTKEIVLIAQDSGIWGLDLKPRENLASLLKRLSEAYPDTWFRVMYLQPAMG